MARVHLYTGGLFKENDKAYTTADVNPEAKFRTREETTGYDAYVYTMQRIKHPQTGDPGWVCNVYLPLAGINQVNYQGSDELVTCPNFIFNSKGPSDTGAFIGYEENPFIKLSGIPENFGAFYNEAYSDIENAPDCNVKAQLLNATPADHMYEARPNMVFEHFYTYGGVYFGCNKSMLAYGSAASATSAIKTVAAFSQSYAGVTGGESYDHYYQFGKGGSLVGLDPSLNNFTRGTSTGTYVQNPRSTISIINDMSYTTVRNMSTERLFLCTVTIPAGANANYAAYDPENPDEEATRFVSSGDATVMPEEVRLIGVGLMTFTEDGVPQSLAICGLTYDYWTGQGGGNWGETSGIEGGEGEFKSDSDEGTGEDAANTAKSRNPGGTGTGWNKDGIMGSMVQDEGGLRLYTNFHVGGLMAVLYSKDWIDRFLQSKYNPMSGIISMYMLPWSCNGKIIYDNLNHTVERYNFTLSGYQLPTYKDVFDGKATCMLDTTFAGHMGDIAIPRYYDSFLDYKTKIEVYLPFCGFVDVPAQLCMGGRVSVDYAIDLLTGACTAYVTPSTYVNGVLRQYPAITATGNCSYQIPISGMEGGNYLAVALNNMNNNMGAISSGVNSAVNAGASGGPMAVASSVGGLASQLGANNRSAALQMLNLETHSQITGNFSGTAIMTNDWNCWVQITRPMQNLPEKYYDLNGHTCDMSGTINKVDGLEEGFSGFLECSEVKLDGIEATDEEKTIINNLMRSGIFV